MMHTIKKQQKSSGSGKQKVRTDCCDEFDVTVKELY